MSDFVDVGRGPLVEGYLRTSVRVLDRDWHIRRAIGIGRIDKPHVIGAWLLESESVPSAELSFILIVVVQIHRANEAADGRAAGPIAAFFSRVVVDYEAF